MTIPFGRMRDVIVTLLIYAVIVIAFLAFFVGIPIAMLAG
jgi:hypothetical protein